jgi:hypothetical protein
MIGLLVVGLMAFVCVAMLGVAASVVSMVCWVLFLPFRILGLVFKGFTALLLLPLFLLARAIGGAFLGVGLLVALLPMLPFALIALAGVWYFRRRPAV